MKEFQKIGVIVAMEVEMEKIREAMDHVRKRSVSGMDFYEGTISGKTVVAARCGVGKVCAAMCAQTMILKYKPDCILGAGIAGSLQGLAIGGVAVADQLVQHDFDLTAFGYPAGYLPAVRRPELITDPEMTETLLQLAAGLGFPKAAGTIVSGDSFISSREQKDRILAAFPSAVACEMEGAAIAQVCVMNRLPFCVIRCISDNGDEASKEDYPAHEAMASAGSATMVLAYIRGEPRLGE